MTAALQRGLLTLALLLAGCDGGQDDEPPADAGRAGELPPLEELPWPREQAALPPCTPSGLDFNAPVLERAGLVAVEFSAPLQPSGVAERVRVTVLTSAGERDHGFAGTLRWSLPAGVQVLSAAPVTAGVAEVTLRFDAPGVTRVQASLDGDPRTGHAEVLIFAPQLPIWELEVPAAELARILAAPDSDERLDAMLSIDGTRHDTQVRLHGGSSRYFPKKSFRFDLRGTADGTWGAHLILRAEYNDKTLLRNWLGMQLFREGTWLPTPRSQLVHFRINGQYYGVMNNVERIDAAFLTARGLRSGASLYEADPPLALGSPGGNLTALAEPELYRLVYPHQGGSIDYDDLRQLIEQTLLLPMEQFERAAPTEIAIDDVLVYLAMMAALQNHDQVRKNFYLYRDLTAPTQPGWLLLPWDLDLTFGHLWSEANDVLEEAIISDADIFVGIRAPERGGFFNQLTDRLLTIPRYRARFRTLLNHLLAQALTREHAERLVANALCRATADLVADGRKRAQNDEYLGRVDEIYRFVEARAEHARSQAEPAQVASRAP